MIERAAFLVYVLQEFQCNKADRHKSRVRVSISHYAEKVKCDGPTDMVAYRVACTRLKKAVLVVDGTLLVV